MCLFDLDGTLLAERTVLRLGERFGVLREVERILAGREDAEPAAGSGETRRVARLFRGVHERDFAAACGSIPRRAHADEAIEGLRAQGFRVGVATASYEHAARPFVAEGVEVVATTGLETSDGVLTGEVSRSAFVGSCGRHVCKETALSRWRAETRGSYTVAVGDGANDVCMMRAADLAIAVTPCHPEARAAADVVVEDLGDVPEVTWRGLHALRL